MQLPELIAGVKPGKPAINLTVGEPQHPIPPFVGAVLRALKEFGRYPPTKGTDGFRAAAAWLERRFALPRPSISKTKCSCSTARARVCFSPRHCQGTCRRATGRPAILVPNPFYAA